MHLARDIRFGLRLMRRSPGFTAAAILVMALGIGANTALFSVLHSTVLAPLPFAHPEQLVQLFETERTPGVFPVSGPDFRDWQRQTTAFNGMSLYRYPDDFALTGHGTPVHVSGAEVEANFFTLLGVKPVVGSLSQNDLQTAVLSYGFWRAEFGGNHGVVGRTMTLNGRGYTIAGVLPASFHWQPQLQVWVPMAMTAAALGRRGYYSFAAIGRLRPDTSAGAAQEELNTIAAGLARQYPATNSRIGVRVVALHNRFVGSSERAALLLLLAATGLVLLIACANLASLLLARGSRRQRGIATRRALGAGGGRIVAQLLGESVLVALCGAAAGMVLAAIALRVAAAVPALAAPAHFDLTVFAFTAVVAVACGVLAGLAPAWQLGRGSIVSALSAPHAVHARGHWGGTLIAGEIALSLALVFLAGLFLESFAQIRSRPLGFAPDHLLTMSISFSAIRGAGALEAFQQNFLGRVQALPGVDSAAFTHELPMEGGNNNGWPVVAGHAAPSRILVESGFVSTSYFKTMKVPLLAGSLYTPAEARAWREQALTVWSRAPAAVKRALPTLPVVVNQALAQSLFPGQNPIGARFRDDRYSPWVVVKGVVGNVPVLGPRAVPMPEVYFPVFSGPYLLVRSRLSAAALTAGIRRTLAQMRAPLPVYNVRPMREVIGESSAGEAAQSGLLAGFAALALLLAAVGVYGTMASWVAGRRRELGLRMALGADGGSLWRMVLGRTLVLAAWGAGGGVILALIAGRIAGNQLYQVPAADPWLLVVAALVVLSAALLAAWLPAQRAARTDPAVVLREL